MYLVWSLSWRNFYSDLDVSGFIQSLQWTLWLPFEIDATSSSPTRASILQYISFNSKLLSKLIQPTVAKKPKNHWQQKLRKDKPTVYQGTWSAVQSIWLFIQMGGK
jgi:hypothetical protein